MEQKHLLSPGTAGRGRALITPPTLADVARALARRPRPAPGPLLEPAPASRPGLVRAAVLVPLVDHPGGATVLFTRRTEHLANHAGQISFPGGRIEDQDPDVLACALRETREEIGVPPEKVDVLGHLPPYPTRTGFLVHPVVGRLSPPLALAPDPREVAEVFEVPLSFLMDPANHRFERKLFEGRMRSFYAMPCGEYYIWGITAGMLRVFYEILEGRCSES